MLSYLARRLLLLFPTLVGITIVVFSVMALSPGGISPAQLIEGNLNPQERSALINYYNQRYGLDQPAPIQYLRWLNNISPIGFTRDENGQWTGFSFIKGSDLGVSFHYGRNVGEILSERLPITLLLNVLTIPLIYVLALFIGIRAATDRGGRFDASSNVILLGLWSVPTMLAGVLLLGFLSNIQHWHWFPTAGLNSRVSNDMPFLPHGLSLGQLLILALAIISSIVMSRALVFIRAVRVHHALNGLILITCSALFTLAHQSPPWWLWLFNVLMSIGCWRILLWIHLPALRLWQSGFYLIFLLGIALVGFFYFWGEGFVRGYFLDRIWHLILPLLCLSYGGFAGLAKLARSSILENLQADFVRTARAKGVDEHGVLWHHVLRNSLLPLVTVTAGLLPSLLAGSLIVENIFSINGMGQLAVEAVKNRDRELVLTITWLSGLLTLLGYLMADVVYTWVDPRVNFD